MEWAMWTCGERQRRIKVQSPQEQKEDSQTCVDLILDSNCLPKYSYIDSDIIYTRFVCVLFCSGFDRYYFSQHGIFGKKEEEEEGKKRKDPLLFVLYKDESQNNCLTNLPPPLLSPKPYYHFLVDQFSLLLSVDWGYTREALYCYMKHSLQFGKTEFSFCTSNYEREPGPSMIEDIKQLWWTLLILLIH